MEFFIESTIKIGMDSIQAGRDVYIKTDLNIK